LASEKDPWYEPGFSVIEGQRVFIGFGGIVWIDGDESRSEPPFGLDEAYLVAQMGDLWVSTAATGKYNLNLDNNALTNRELAHGL